MRQLEKLETAHIAHLQYEYAQREAKYQETIHLIQEDYARFRKEVDKEVALKDIIIERGEQFNHVLKKELVVAQNIIRTPMIFNKASKDLNTDKYMTYNHQTMGDETFEDRVKLLKSRQATPSNAPLSP